MKQKNILITSFLLLLVLIFSLIYLNKNKKTSEQTVTIGSIVPLTGETAIHGIRVKHGIELAVEEINRTGGIDGKKLEVSYEDSQCDPAKATASAYKLLSEGIQVLLGPQCSSEAMAVAPIAEENKILMFASIASVPALSNAGDYIFRNSESGSMHGTQMADFVYKKLNIKTVAILYINLDNGIAYKDSFKDTFESLGGKIVAIESYEKGNTDFRTPLTKIKIAKPELIYIGGQAAEHAIKQIKELGIDSKIASMNGIEVPELWQVAGDAAEGVYFTSSAFDPLNKNPQIQSFVKEYNKRYEEEVEAFSANGYDATMLIAEGLKKCGENPTCIKDYLYSTKDYPGVGGSISFDANGDVKKVLEVKIAKDRSFSVYKQ